MTGLRWASAIAGRQYCSAAELITNGQKQTRLRTFSNIKRQPSVNHNVLAAFWTAATATMRVVAERSIRVGSSCR